MRIITKNKNIMVVLSLFDGILFGINCGIYYICAWKN